MKRGPQPPEGLLSGLLQEFPAYTVETLLAADWLTLERILDYRHARLAIDLFNGGPQGVEQLGNRPDLTDLLLELGKAQAGEQTRLQDVYGALKAQQPDTQDDEDD